MKFWSLISVMFEVLAHLGLVLLSNIPMLPLSLYLFVLFVYKTSISFAEAL